MPVTELRLKKKIAFAAQIPGFDLATDLLLIIQHGDNGTRSNVEASFQGAAITQGDAETGIGPEQAFFAHGNYHAAATGKGAHN